jgi:hypothetical protein
MPLPAIVETQKLSQDQPLPIRIHSITATGLDTVVEQIEIFGLDANGIPSSIFILDQTLTGDQINSARIGDRGFIYSKSL